MIVKRVGVLKNSHVKMLNPRLVKSITDYSEMLIWDFAGML